ncbi:hypothetical protein ES703_30843 [subsurface metagenome]
MSLGARGQLGKALVFFGWKGLDVVREYVIPANPQTTAQNLQRGYLRTAVAAIHAAQGQADHVLSETDIRSYALWASRVQAATTWFNQAVRNFVDQLIAGKTPKLYTDGSSLPGATTLRTRVHDVSTHTTAGNFKYGTSKTALINSIAADVAGNQISKIIPDLTAGVKYFWQFEPTTPVGLIGAKSGIYYGVAA